MWATRRAEVIGALLAAWALLCGPAAAEPAPVVTRHEIHIDGRALAYTAETGRVAIRDVGTGEPVGYVFYVAYRAPAAPGKTRPISFIWNGGQALRRLR